MTVKQGKLGQKDKWSCSRQHELGGGVESRTTRPFENSKGRSTGGRGSKGRKGGKEAIGRGEAKEWGPIRGAKGGGRENGRGGRGQKRKAGGKQKQNKSLLQFVWACGHTVGRAVEAKDGVKGEKGEQRRGPKQAQETMRNTAQKGRNRRPGEQTRNRHKARFHFASMYGFLFASWGGAVGKHRMGWRGMKAKREGGWAKEAKDRGKGKAATDVKNAKVHSDIIVFLSGLVESKSEKNVRPSWS